MTPEEIAHYYIHDSLGGFSTALMDLFGKADMFNRQKLGEAFPEYYQAYIIWFSGGAE